MVVETISVFKSLYPSFSLVLNEESCVVNVHLAVNFPPKVLDFDKIFGTIFECLCNVKYLLTHLFVF